MLFILLAAACTTSIDYSTPSCSLTITAVDPASAAPGESIVVYASPLTESWDTTANLGSTPVEELNVDRSTCGECDTCREEEGCDLCGDCDACDLSCEASCVEYVSLVVPSLPPGEAQLLLYNSRGSSRPFPIEIVAEVDSAP